MPPKAKPPAVPVEMPRTEADLDRLMVAVEVHKAEGNRLGERFVEGKMTPEEVLEGAAIADAKLYDICDEIAIERSDEFVAKDDQLSEGRRGR